MGWPSRAGARAAARVHPYFVHDTQIAVPETLRCGQWQELLTGRTLAFGGEQMYTDALFTDLPTVVLECRAR